MKLSQLSLADYNQLDSIPVINQDLSATDFTPVANTYYRHTGATTDTFTQGVIYLYDTAYHKLGESGGGTTLNKYKYTTSNSLSSYTRFFNILENAKIVKYIKDMDGTPVNFVLQGSNNLKLYRTKLYYVGGDNPGMTGEFIKHAITKSSGKGVAEVLKIVNTNTNGTNTISSTGTQTQSVYYQYTVEYYNDTEITA